MKSTDMTPVTLVSTVTPIESDHSSEILTEVGNEDNSKEKAGNRIYIMITVLVLLTVAAGIVCYRVWSDSGDMDGQNNPLPVNSVSVQQETVNTAELIAEADELMVRGKEQTAVDTELPDGMQKLTDAIKLYVQTAEESGDTDSVSDKAVDAYRSLTSAVLRHKEMMEGSLSGGIYAQIMGELNDVASLGETLESGGYQVDVSTLVDAIDAFDTSYTERVALEFNSFTEREMWSRTECWNLMKDTAGNMFDTADLDDPIRLRYAYALSWWVQRQIETELANGIITQKGAAIKIANLIDEMDYNPMMIGYYITFMESEGEDCAGVKQAYQEVIDRLSDTQGIEVGKKIGLDRFWYFNDFEHYPVDDRNGVTQENRQWIRERMKLVSFKTEM